MDIKYTKCFLGNEWRDSCDGKTMEVRNPATDEVLCKVAECDKADVDLAVTLARKTFNRKSAWGRTKVSDRADILMKMADLVRQNQDELMKLETINNGKALSSSGHAIDFVCKVTKYMAGLGECVEGKTKALDGDDFCFTRKDPIGVCGVIIPWNYPLELFMMTVAPAIVSGCTIVLKPAEATPLTALYLCELFKQAGLPEGVLSVLPGYGPTVGAAIAEHIDIDCVHFTGSTTVGRLIKRASAFSNLKRVVLELGGKSPVIVCKDSNLDLAVKMANFAVMENSGQVCIAGSRTYVHSSIYDEFVKKTVEQVKYLKVGNGLEKDTNLGPLINEIQMDKVLAYIASGVEEGAKIEYGGKRIGTKGWFVEPTIMTGVTDDMKICKEEIFGPVQSILKFDDLDDVIDRANNTKYGLAAAVFTQDITTGIHVSKLLQAGTVWVNSYFSAPVNLPFGGIKQSGEGISNGMEGLDHFYTKRSIVVGMPKSM